MAGKIFTEPIRILSYAITRATGGGQSKGSETVKYDTIATIKPRKESRYTNDGSSKLSNTYELEIYRNPDVLIDSNDQLEWRSSTLKILDILETDDYRKYKITAQKQ